ncbi:hypothetical protein [Sinorhizobium meliloti]|uniref:hypothetical protein n=1 Tax=Rhizobium meliloti TaxID=382 RepID=UPI00398CB218
MVASGIETVHQQARRLLQNCSPILDFFESFDSDPAFLVGYAYWSYVSLKFDLAQTQAALTQSQADLKTALDAAQANEEAVRQFRRRKRPRRKMQDLIDAELQRIFKRTVAKAGRGTMHDPRYPYRATVEPTKAGHLIRIEHTRKRWRWFGREVLRFEHTPDHEGNTVASGPAEWAIGILEDVIANNIR